jgi:hypothetical protein
MHRDLRRRNAAEAVFGACLWATAFNHEGQPMFFGIFMAFCVL